MMASQLPTKLKGELGRFATRAAQLEKYRPIVTYWCMSLHAPGIPHPVPCTV